MGQALGFYPQNRGFEYSTFLGIKLFSKMSKSTFEKINV